MGEQKVKICVDHREFRGDMVKILFDLNAEIETSTLEVGDYILSDDVVVELKTSADFAASLIDKRLFTQAGNLKSNFSKPLYIIEGELNDLFEARNIHPNALRAAMISLVLDYSIPIIFSRSKRETAEILFLIAKREQLTNRKEISLRGTRRAWSLPEQQQFFIEGLPLVGPKLAKNLLAEFGNPLSVLTANVDDLQKVDKLGGKKAEAIRRILEKEYQLED